MANFTIKDVVNAVIGQAEAFPKMKYHGSTIPASDTINLSCSYVNEDGEPDCIVACALASLGVSMGQLRSMEGDAAPSVVARLLGLNLSETSKDENKDLFFLEKAQVYQDRNYEWLTAIKLAKEMAYA